MDEYEENGSCVGAGDALLVGGEWCRAGGDGDGRLRRVQCVTSPPARSRSSAY